MKRFDLFGTKEQTLTETADAVARAIGVSFELHESGYLGGEYFRSLGLEGEEVLVQANAEDEEGYLTEPDFADFPTLVYVNRGSEEFARALEAVPELELLRSEAV